MADPVDIRTRASIDMAISHATDHADRSRRASPRFVGFPAALGNGALEALQPEAGVNVGLYLLSAFAAVSRL
jgi:hypothetical protein